MKAFLAFGVIFGSILIVWRLIVADRRWKDRNKGDK
jgi:hypothetical protein